MQVDGGQQMPEQFTIGTKKAFENNQPYTYKRAQIGSETIYVCTQGSDGARKDEGLVLRCETNHDGSSGTWTAFDSSVNKNGTRLQCRQPVFRCLATDITQPGWHEWQTNWAANVTDPGSSSEEWQGGLWAETRVHHA